MGRQFAVSKADASQLGCKCVALTVPAKGVSSPALLFPSSAKHKVGLENMHAGIIFCKSSKRLMSQGQCSEGGGEEKEGNKLQG